jgi:hypothetical protein
MRVASAIDQTISRIDTQKQLTVLGYVSRGLALALERTLYELLIES